MRLQHRETQIKRTQTGVETGNKNRFLESMNRLNGACGAPNYEDYGYGGPSTSSPPDCEDLEASFVSDETLLKGSDPIDDFCNTYLGSMDFGASKNLEGLEELESYNALNIEEWRTEDCLQWASDVCRKREINTYSVNLWIFENSTGADLLAFNAHHFCAALGDDYGPLFHQEFQIMRKKKKKKKKKDKEAVGTHQRVTARCINSLGTQSDRDREYDFEYDDSNKQYLGHNMQEHREDNSTDPATENSASTAVSVKIKTTTRRGEFPSDINRTEVRIYVAFAYMENNDLLLHQYCVQSTPSLLYKEWSSQSTHFTKRNMKGTDSFLAASSLVDSYNTQGGTEAVIMSPNGRKKDYYGVRERMT
ncbi:hypothetical protein SK128_011127 [Halocaridina rubra]|uniref:Uncharacterized protein n=1 Tax=Halocaridina rubra TaxID=373956 RepID=A0AAN8XIT5_HALRR